VRRRRAVESAQAWLRNPPLPGARELMDDARAQRGQAVSTPETVGARVIPPPLGIPTTKPVGAMIAVPFPDQLRL